MSRTVRRICMRILGPEGLKSYLEVEEVSSSPAGAHHGRCRRRQPWLVVIQLHAGSSWCRMDGAFLLQDDEHYRQYSEGDSWAQSDDRMEGGVS